MRQLKYIFMMLLSYLYTAPSCEDVVGLFKELCSDKRVNLNVRTLSGDQVWDVNDLTTDEFVDWVKKNPEGLLKKICGDQVQIPPLHRVDFVIGETKITEYEHADRIHNGDEVAIITSERFTPENFRLVIQDFRDLRDPRVDRSVRAEKYLNFYNPIEEVLAFCEESRARAADSGDNISCLKLSVIGTDPHDIFVLQEGFLRISKKVTGTEIFHCFISITSLGFSGRRRFNDKFVKLLSNPYYHHAIEGILKKSRSAVYAGNELQRLFIYSGPLF